MTAKLTVRDIQQQKGQEKISMLTAYDFPTALLVERAGIEIILVGDSLAMTVMGLESTVPVTMEEMLHHTRAVSRACRKSLVVGDMPFLSYSTSSRDTLANAGRFLKEAGADAVKVEGGGAAARVVGELVEAGIPVMGHLGLTPQTAGQLGGYKVQGRDPQQSRKIKEDARLLVEAGIFSLVLECVPLELARDITAEIAVPTIGIGAGPYCDGQVLVYHDLLGLFSRFTPRFVKHYARLEPLILEALNQYREEVKSSKFPEEKHSFS